MKRLVNPVQRETKPGSSGGHSLYRKSAVRNEFEQKGRTRLHLHWFFIFLDFGVAAKRQNFSHRNKEQGACDLNKMKNRQILEEKKDQKRRVIESA